MQSFDQLGVTERRHGLIPAGAGTERIRLEPAIGRTVDAVVASSYDEEADLTRLGIPRRHIRVVPTGIDTSEFTPEGPTHDRNDRHRLVTVADLAAESESLAILLQAMAKIPGAELVVAGGPAREDLRGDLTYRRLAKLSDTLDLHGRVFFAGQVGRAALPPLLRSADLMVNVNQHEAIGHHLHPGHGLRHPRRRDRQRRPPRRRRRRHHRHPGRSPCARPCWRRRSAPCWPTRCSSRRSASPRPTGPGPGTPGTGSRTRRWPSTTPPSPPK